MPGARSSPNKPAKAPCSPRRSWDLPPVLGFVLSIALAVSEILYAWAHKLRAYTMSQSDEDRLTDELQNATTYAQWFHAAVALDNLPERYNWRVNPVDKLYDYRHLDERRKELNYLRRNDRPAAVVNYIRHGLLRNLFNITKLALFDQNYTSTKESIQWYIEESMEAIRYIGESPTALTSAEGRLTEQDKLEALHDSRSTFGKTALLLQGGSIFGLCHLGVMKALNEHDILPNVIVGTSTGALMAALVGVRTAEELPVFLNSSSIDLSAFSEASAEARQKAESDKELTEHSKAQSSLHNWYNILERRFVRLIEQGFLLDPEVLAECIKANVGDITFEEAYKRTGRILNIIISSPSEEVPNLMNYLTAPNVLIRSAALASHVTNMARVRDSSIQLLQKDANGTIRTVEVSSPHAGARVRRPPSAMDRTTPLTRLKQLFNVDNFIISQARPYIAPFMKPSLPYVRRQRKTWLQSMTSSSLLFTPSAELIKQGLINADLLGILPDGLRRILSDESVHGDSITLIPEVGFADWRRLLKNPSKEEVDFWMMRGERAVWPALCALKVRCVIEFSLEQAYEKVRRRGPSDPDPPATTRRLNATLTPPAGALSSLRMTSGPFALEENPFDAFDEKKDAPPKFTVDLNEG